MGGFTFMLILLISFFIFAHAEVISNSRLIGPNAPGTRYTSVACCNITGKIRWLGSKTNRIYNLDPTTDVWDDEGSLSYMFSHTDTCFANRIIYMDHQNYGRIRKFNSITNQLTSLFAIRPDEDDACMAIRKDIDRYNNVWNIMYILDLRSGTWTQSRYESPCAYTNDVLWVYDVEKLVIGSNTVTQITASGTLTVCITRLCMYTNTLVKTVFPTFSNITKDNYTQYELEFNPTKSLKSNLTSSQSTANYPTTFEPTTYPSTIVTSCDYAGPKWWFYQN
eukprot:257864_1